MMVLGFFNRRIVIISSTVSCVQARCENRVIVYVADYLVMQLTVNVEYTFNYC